MRSPVPAHKRSCLQQCTQTLMSSATHSIKKETRFYYTEKQYKLLWLFCMFSKIVKPFWVPFTILAKVICTVDNGDNRISNKCFLFNSLWSLHYKISILQQVKLFFKVKWFNYINWEKREMTGFNRIRTITAGDRLTYLSLVVRCGFKVTPHALGCSPAQWRLKQMHFFAVERLAAKYTLQRVQVNVHKTLWVQRHLRLTYRQTDYFT